MSLDISSTDDMIDIRDVIERFEELEALRNPWRAGWNKAGFMPDSEPESFESFEDAKEYIDGALVDCLDHLEGEALEELQGVIDATTNRLSSAKEGEWGETVSGWAYWIAPMSGVEAFEDESEGEEYEALKSLLEDLKGYGGDEEWRGDWYPISLIRDSYFVEAMQELCEDIGDIPRGGLPSYYVIDWEATANNLRVDYSSVEFDGVTYWYR